MKNFRLIPCLLCFALSSSAAAERFNLEHAAKIVDVANPQISPDGRSIVVLVTRTSLKDNRDDTELVQVDVATKAQRVLTQRPAGQLRLSPDGKRLAFLSAVDGKMQIFVLPMDGGEAAQVSKAVTSVGVYAWRPDGQAFAYTATEEAPKREGEEKANRSFEADVNYLSTEAPRASHLWLVSAEGGEGKRLTAGTWSVWGNLGWSPDGKRIVFGYQPAPGGRFFMDQTSRVLDVASGAVRPLSERTKLDISLGFSPDGEHFAYTWPREGDNRYMREMWVAATGGRPARNLTGVLDANVDAAQWTPDSRGLILSMVKGSSNGLWLQSLDGSARRLELGRLNLYYYVKISQSGQLAFVGNEPGRPNELYYMESLDSTPQRLTDFNAHIAGLELGKQESILWRGPDNFDMDGVLTYPPGYQAGRPYPLVLLIHGGPGDASTIGFEVRSQWLASHDWVVFEPNYRGSNNLGNNFKAAIWNDAGGGPGRDVMSGVDLLVKKGIADPARMAVSGWSYGGYMTVWLLGNYPDRWRAGVAGAAVTDHIDQYVLSNIHSNIATYYGGSPFTDPKRLQAYHDQAPITHAHKIKAPTLILHNTGDQRVPIIEAYILYHVLRDNGVKVKFIAYPMGGHQPSDPVHSRDVNRRWAGWIKEHLEATR